MTKIFVLGDSRTGTTSLHKFLQAAGYKSIHYYFGESGVQEGGAPDVPAGKGPETNWELLKHFIDTSGYDAFSDYPTRTYFRELMSAYTDAKFILTRRADLETWQRSMREFMGKFGLKLDIDALSSVHVSMNDEIRERAATGNLKFCEINIDASSAENSEILRKFLGLQNGVQLGRENATDSYDLRLWSKRATLFDLPDGDLITYAENACAPHKGMLSEQGWVYLINDSSNYLHYLYGQKSWSDAQTGSAIDTLKARCSILGERGVVYQKYVIPEKSAVYDEYMPTAFARLQVSNQRPAQKVADKGISCFSYPIDVLRDAKSRGNLYFRGDSHANWLGAYFIYHHIVTNLNKTLKPSTTIKPILLRQLIPSLAGYAGDIATQLSPDHQRILRGVWADISFEGVYEYLVKYELPAELRSARPAKIEEDYLSELGERPTFRFKRDDKDLPRAVVFRDSTSDWLVDLLAEHFSESLFIWHKGLVYEDVIKREQADVVLHIQAERFFVTGDVAPIFANLLPSNLSPNIPSNLSEHSSQTKTESIEDSAVPEPRSKWNRLKKRVFWSRRSS